MLRVLSRLDEVRELGSLGWEGRRVQVAELALLEKSSSVDVRGRVTMLLVLVEVDVVVLQVTHPGQLRPSVFVSLGDEDDGGEADGDSPLEPSCLASGKRDHESKRGSPAEIDTPATSAEEKQFGSQPHRSQGNRRSHLRRDGRTRPRA